MAMAHSVTSKSAKTMGKKEKWQPESAALTQAAFSVLAGLKTSAGTAEPRENKTPKSSTAVVEKEDASGCKLPKVKSSRLERAHHGGKTVTVVTFHGEPSDEAKTQWLKSMKRDLGVGGSIEDGNVMLQGDQRDRL